MRENLCGQFAYDKLTLFPWTITIDLKKMTDVQLLIASPFGILAFYFVMKYLYRIANKAKPESGQKMKKSLKPIIIIYAIGMTIQLVYLVDKIFFN